MGEIVKVEDGDGNEITIIGGNIFKSLKRDLDTLGTIDEKIAYVIKQKCWYLQADDVILTDDNPELPFDKKCDLELEMLRELKALELEKERLERTLPLEERQAQSKGGIKKHKDLTIDRAILLMKHLAPRLIGCDQNKVAEIIAFLIGRDSEAVRQRFSKLKNKFLDQPEAYNDDVKIVCEYLNLIGLTNEAERLKKDSGVI